MAALLRKSESEEDHMKILIASTPATGHMNPMLAIARILVIDSSPEIAELAVDLHEHLIQMPTPLGEAAQMRNSLLSDLCREHRAKPVPSKSAGLMADVDPELGQEILDVSQRQWVPHVHHHDQTKSPLASC
jgi:hypothetical protein